MGVVGPQALPRTRTAAAFEPPSGTTALNAVSNATGAASTSRASEALKCDSSQAGPPRETAPLPPLKGQLPPRYADAVKAAIRRGDDPEKNSDGGSSGDSLGGGMTPIEEEDLGWGEEEEGALDGFSIDLSSLVVPQVRGGGGCGVGR